MVGSRRNILRSAVLVHPYLWGCRLHHHYPIHYFHEAFTVADRAATALECREVDKSIVMAGGVTLPQTAKNLADLHSASVGLPSFFKIMGFFNLTVAKGPTIKSFNLFEIK